MYHDYRTPTRDLRQIAGTGLDIQPRPAASDERGEEHPNDEPTHAPEPRDAANADIRARSDADQDRRERSGERDGELEIAVHQERVFHPIRALAQDDAAEPDNDIAEFAAGST